ncbi:MAG: hypothetical protein U0637_03900 [Phycisphaerales bacterium]
MPDVPPPIPVPPAPLGAASATGFKLRWYTVLLGVGAVGLFLLAALVTPVPVEGSSAYGVGYAVGRIAGALTCPAVAALLVGVIAFFATGRSTRALNISMSVVLLLMMVLGLGSLAMNLIRMMSA